MIHRPLPEQVPVSLQQQSSKTFHSNPADCSKTCNTMQSSILMIALYIYCKWQVAIFHHLERRSKRPHQLIAFASKLLQPPSADGHAILWNHLEPTRSNDDWWSSMETTPSYISEHPNVTKWSNLWNKNIIEHVSCGKHLKYTQSVRWHFPNRSDTDFGANLMPHTEPSEINMQQIAATRKAYSYSPQEGTIARPT